MPHTSSDEYVSDSERRQLRRSKSRAAADAADAKKRKDKKKKKEHRRRRHHSESESESEASSRSESDSGSESGSNCSCDSDDSVVMSVQAIAMTCMVVFATQGRKRVPSFPCSLSRSVDLSIIHYFNTSFIVFLSRSQLDTSSLTCNSCTNASTAASRPARRSV